MQYYKSCAGLPGLIPPYRQNVFYKGVIEYNTHFITKYM